MRIRRFDWINSAARTGDFFRSSVVKIVFSALIIGWVKPHDTLRSAPSRSSLSLQAQDYRKEWLPPSWASGTLSQFPVQTINLALRWVIGFTRWDQSDTVCGVSVCPSVRRLAPVLSKPFCAVSSFIPSASLGRFLSMFFSQRLRWNFSSVFDYSLLVCISRVRYDSSNCRIIRRTPNALDFFDIIK